MQSWEGVDLEFAMMGVRLALLAGNDDLNVSFQFEAEAASRDLWLFIWCFGLAASEPRRMAEEIVATQLPRGRQSCSQSRLRIFFSRPRTSSRSLRQYVVIWNHLDTLIFMNHDSLLTSQITKIFCHCHEKKVHKSTKKVVWCKHFQGKGNARDL